MAVRVEVTPMNLIEEIDNFIQRTKVAREQKRALAAKMAVLRKPSSEIQSLLGVSREFVTKWKNKAIFEGVESLRLQYKGSQGYLSTEEKAEVIQWLQSQKDCQIDHLIGYIDRQYGVVYASRKSYYELLDRAGMSWKKTQKVRAKRNKAGTPWGWSQVS